MNTSIPAVIALAISTTGLAAQDIDPTAAHVIGLDGTCGAPTPEQAAWLAQHDTPDAIAARAHTIASVGRLGSPARTAGLDIQFILSPAAAADSDLIGALEEAAQFYEDRYTDDVIIRFSIDNQTGVSFLAATSRFTQNRSYSSVRAALVNSASPVEQDLINALPTSAPTYLRDGGLSSSVNLSVTFAQSIALGFGDPNGTNADSSITFNADINWDYDRSNGIASNAFDIVGTAAHEFGHALGFISATGLTSNPTIWDLFRTGSEGFPNDVDNLPQFTAATRVIRTGDRAAFDTAGGIDGFFVVGGKTPPSFDLSTGTGPGGDGRQASHWRDNNITGTTIGIMDPTGSTGELDIFSDADIAAFDVMGYDLFVPPASCNTADLAQPFGTLDLADVQTFLIAFSASDPAADLFPEGGDAVYDLADVQTFLIAFGAGCP